MSNILKESIKGDITCLKIVANKVDALNAPTLEKEFLEAVNKGCIKILVDLSELTYISSAGLRAILSFAKEAKAKNRKLAIAVTDTNVKKVFDASGFTSLLDIQNSVDAAMKKF